MLTCCLVANGAFTDMLRVFRHCFVGSAKSTLKLVRYDFLGGDVVYSPFVQVLPVIEAEQQKIPDDEGNEVAVPVNMADPNPNGVEFDSLYLDMNGIVSQYMHRLP